MIILKAKFIMLCDENFTILRDKAVAFEDKILKLGEASELIKEFPNAEFFDEKDAIIAPAFINPHVHLEFSANKTSLVYGDFLEWLSSVIASRSELSKEASEQLIKDTIKEIQRSGVGTIGAVSSFASDFKPCVNSTARIIYFNEILGTNEEILESNWQNFISRFQRSKEAQNELFIPAISVHSPYSAHPDLAARALKIARDENLLVSTHLMESNHEKEWLMKGSGGFKKWLSKFNKSASPFYDPNSFISMFSGIKTLFTHCVYLNDFSKFERKFHSVTHCAFSNRLLSKATLNLQNLIDNKIPFNIGTDGLSSNISLNFFDELRANLLIHNEFDPKTLAQILILASTSNAAKALGLNLGEIRAGKIADIAVYKGLGQIDEKELALMFLLHTKNCKKLYINGKLCKL
ncbi:aminofutalosine deaminase family hydrolase [Campylobacter sp.]|uniref:aminofutalosine deaminase family hydrolase n=1 Tax=Campylobacter sp. TaxID=205 RepID=UPI0027026359|nr:metal-dependent hydrolase [Campylobacter sp.]